MTRAVIPAGVMKNFSVLIFERNKYLHSATGNPYLMIQQESKHNLPVKPGNQGIPLPEKYGAVVQKKILTEENIYRIKVPYDVARMRLILLDYEGTLTPLIEDPELLTPSQEIIYILQKLIHDPGNDIILCSGKNVETLEHWFGHLPIGISCQYGTFHKKKGKWAGKLNLEKLAKSQPYDFILGIWDDDDEDEKFFSLCPEKTYTIKVGKDTRVCKYIISHQPEVLPFLDYLS